MSSSIVFARSLYSVDAVRAAAEAYAGLARVEVVLHEDEIELRATELDAELGRDLLDELANHALFETVIRHRAGDGGSDAGAS